MQLTFPLCGATRGAGAFASFQLTRCPACRERGVTSYLSAAASVRRTLRRSEVTRGDRGRANGPG